MGLRRAKWSAILVYAIALIVACAGMTRLSNAQGWYPQGPAAMPVGQMPNPAMMYPMQPGFVPGAAYAPGPGYPQAFAPAPANVVAYTVQPASRQEDTEQMPVPMNDADSYGGDCCDQGGCGKASCQKCDSIDCCCKPCCLNWTFGAFVEGLYIRPRNAEVAYAVPVDGPVTAPPLEGVQVGPVAVVDPDAEIGYRVGFSVGLSDCSVATLTYTKFDSATTNEVSINPPNVILPLTIHPLAINAAITGLDASARLDVDFETIDADYRWAVVCCDDYYIAVLGGLRYGQLNQQFAANYDVLGEIDVETDVDFDGYGIRLGGEAEKVVNCSGFFVYGKGTGNFLGGDVRARYFEGSQQDPVIVDTTWEAGRLVSILEGEVGAGWQSCDGRIRGSLGYQVAGWFNTVTTADFINAVQTSEFDGIGDKITFDGWAARVEVRY